MALEDGKDVRDFLWQTEEHMAIKEKTRMLKFQAKVYRNALKSEQKMLDNLIATQDKRKESYKPKYESIEELDEAYGRGGMDDREYMRQRSSIWQVYSDRGHINNMKWLEEMLAEVERKQAAVEEVKAMYRQASRKYNLSRQQARSRKTDYERRRRRKIRKKELEERWHRYGIG